MDRLRIDNAEIKRAIKIIVAASLAWWIGTLAGFELPVFAAIVPLVAIRKEDPFSAISVSLGRILGVFVGVFIGLGALEISGYDVTLLLAVVTIAVSVALGLVLRTGEEINVQIAVSALIMLFLSDSAGSIAGDRIWETAIGALVAIGVSWVLWPPDPVARVRQSLPQLRQQLCDDLRVTVALLADPHDTDVVLDAVRSHQLAVRDEALRVPHARRSLRWNLLRRGDEATLDRLGQRLLSFARVHRHVRSLARSIADSTPAAIEAARPAQPYLESSAGHVVDAFEPRIEPKEVQHALDEAGSALDDFAAAGDGRLATVLEIDMRRIVSDLREDLGDDQR